LDSLRLSSLNNFQIKFYLDLNEKNQTNSTNDTLGQKILFDAYTEIEKENENSLRKVKKLNTFSAKKDSEKYFDVQKEIKRFSTIVEKQFRNANNNSYNYNLDYKKVTYNNNIPKSNYNNYENVNDKINEFALEDIIIEVDIFDSIKEKNLNKKKNKKDNDKDTFKIKDIGKNIDINNIIKDISINNNINGNYHDDKTSLIENRKSKILKQKKTEKEKEKVIYKEIDIQKKDLIDKFESKNNDTIGENENKDEKIILKKIIDKKIDEYKIKEEIDINNNNNKNLDYNYNNNGNFSLEDFEIRNK
jgi:hypothetical protein